MSNNSEMKKLLAKVEYPESWKPEKIGESIVGEALRWETVPVKVDDGTERACEVLTVRCEDGTERSVWTWHTVLQSELIGQGVTAGDYTSYAVQPGNLVAIVFRGKRPRQNGDGSYTGYRVAIDNGAQQSAPTPEEELRILEEAEAADTETTPGPDWRVA